MDIMHSTERNLLGTAIKYLWQKYSLLKKRVKS